MQSPNRIVGPIQIQGQFGTTGYKKEIFEKSVKILQTLGTTSLNQGDVSMREENQSPVAVPTSFLRL
jgi:hypothetical protein